MCSAQSFSVIVIGGGHAGTEAALVSARMGLSTLLLTHNIETIGQMSCNPSIGGIGKTHLVKEVDALDGAMGKAADCAGIQFRVLNASKGPAVRATRVQVDRILYKAAIRKMVENQENLSLFQQAVDDLLIDNNRVVGVVTTMGLVFYANAVVITAGTFLDGKIHIGLTHYQAGRAGDPAAMRLSEKLRELPLRVGRFKTGTPPRIDGRTIDYRLLIEQPGDNPRPVMSYLGSVDQHPQQMSCYMTYTNLRTHEIIRAGLKDSPLYTGLIEGVGPRYCPSIEDKILRFHTHDKHQIFLEPEGLQTHEVYPNGVSTSLPFEVQQDFIHSIVGLENAHILRPGYAIEYDFFDPRDLFPSLESKFIGGLFFAGQINGTTGYEEAAAQGLVAGINAALMVQGRPSWTPGRDESYIGVLIDDLTTCGTKEPYRMFTSRAEYRLLLRQDNADLRLTEKGYAIGCVGEARWKAFNIKQTLIAKEKERLESTWIRVNTENVKNNDYRAIDLLKRPDITYLDLHRLCKSEDDLNYCENYLDIYEQIEIQIKYEGYIARQKKEIDRVKRYENNTISIDFDYHSISGLSHEVRQKLLDVRPTTVGQASRIPGVTPAAISLLLVYLKTKQDKNARKTRL